MTIQKAHYGLIAGALVIVLLSAALVWKIQDNRTNNDSNIGVTGVHYHAGFLVYENGSLIDFSVLQYMKIAPCEIESDDQSPDEYNGKNDQIEKAHLHDLVGDVVHVHRSNATWNDLFLNLGYELKKPVIGYRDGQIVEDILDQPILENESIILLTGDSSSLDPTTLEYVSTEHIVEIGQKSENCGSNDEK